MPTSPIHFFIDKNSMVGISFLSDQKVIVKRLLFYLQMIKYCLKNLTVNKNSSEVFKINVQASLFLRNKKTKPATLTQ